jgi:hypothetical protein
MIILLPNAGDTSKQSTAGRWRQGKPLLFVFLDNHSQVTLEKVNPITW